MNRRTLKMGILRAKAERNRRRRVREEQATFKLEKKQQRARKEAERKAKLSARREAAFSARSKAEETLRSKRASETSALKASREAHKARLLSERELRREKLRPYTEALTKVGKSIYQVGKGIYKVAEKVTRPKPGQKSILSQPLVKPATQKTSKSESIGKIDFWGPKM